MGERGIGEVQNNKISFSFVVFHIIWCHFIFSVFVSHSVHKFNQVS